MTSKAFGLAQLGNAYADGALSNRNILINGNFSIWQRGDYTTATAASHNTYYPDRWKIESGLSQTIQDTNRSAKVSVTSGGTNIVGLRQVVEDKNRVITLGKQVTFSAKVISNSSNARLCIYADGWSVGSAHSGNGTEETLTVTVTVASSLTYGLIAEVSICGAGYSNVAISSGDYIEFTEAQLEVGDTATPFEHRSYGAELALCQRYYEVGDFYGYFTTSNSGSFNPDAIYQGEFKVQKRTAPSMTQTNYVNVGSAVSGSPSNITVHGFVQAIEIAGGGFVGGHDYDWQADAEL